MLKRRQMMNAKASKKTQQMVKAIRKGQHVDAYKLLEQVVKAKVANRIDAALKED